MRSQLLYQAAQRLKGIYVNFSPPESCCTHDATLPSEPVTHLVAATTYVNIAIVAE